MSGRGSLIAIVLIVLTAEPTLAAGMASADTPNRQATVADEPALIDTHGVNNSTSAPPDPPNDTIGWENGYWYNESINVSQTGDSYGLTAAERERLLARAMARAEHLRQLEFTENVTLRFISREAFARGVQNRSLPAQYNSSRLYESLTLNDQFWEAVFFYGEQTQSSDRILRFISNTAVGYASEEGLDNTVVIITRSPEDPVVTESLLIHELVHVLQNQQFNLSAPRYRSSLHDRRLAIDGIIEGGATYVGYLYRQRCQNEWDCLDAPQNPSGAQLGDQRAQAILFRQPYTDGSGLVQQLVEREGWTTVNDVHRAPPQTSEQVIHADLERGLDSELSVPDASTPDWKLMDRDRVGEATIYMMFWKQSRERDPSTIRWEELQSGSPPDAGDYTSPPSSGWANDQLLLYQNGDQQGYVWVTEWESPTDAQEFATSYQTLLESYGANQVGQQTWVIPDGKAFADAFHVVQEGTTVRIVNAASVDQLSGLQPEITVEEQTTTATATPTMTQEPTETTTTIASEPTTRATTEPTETTQESPGFTLLIAVLSVLLYAGYRRYR